MSNRAKREDRLENLDGKEAGRAWRLAHKLDKLLESQQRQGNSADHTMEQIAPWLMGELNLSGFGVRFFDKEKIWHELLFGDDDEKVLSILDKKEEGEWEDGMVCAVSLSVDGEAIGLLAATFAKAPPPPGAILLLDVVGQELDNIFFEFRKARNRHIEVLEIEKRLQEPVLDITIDNTARFIMERTNIEGIVVVYQEDLLEKAARSYRVYWHGAVLTTSDSGSENNLSDLLKEKTQPWAKEVLLAAGLTAKTVAKVQIPAGSQANQGFVVVAGPAEGLSRANRELVQVFAIALGQRLVDYHKEQRWLQQFFSPSVVTRLLQERDYRERYLSPRERTAAILFADITSFTAISEQILSGPTEVGQFIDQWSDRVVNILWEHGGAFDKMVGDCVIGLFGPPFEDYTPAECVARALRAAIAINDFTAKMSGSPVVEKIKKSSVIPGLGVATGVNVGEVMVGTIGPNYDFTAFGREMNNTARLQGVAGYREILVMVQAYEKLVAEKHPLLEKIEWGNVQEKAVKNVKEPLRFLEIEAIE